MGRVLGALFKTFFASRQEELDERQEVEWEPVAKARSMPEAHAEDAVLDFLLTEGWLRHPEEDDHLWHPVHSPTACLTLGDAFAFEQRRSAD